MQIEAGCNKRKQTRILVCLFVSFLLFSFSGELDIILPAFRYIFAMFKIRLVEFNLLCISCKLPLFCTMKLFTPIDMSSDVRGVILNRSGYKLINSRKLIIHPNIKFHNDPVSTSGYETCGHDLPLLLTCMKSA
jgi:hypothetical protein